MDFTKLGMCIDIVKICFRIANGQITSHFDRVICPPHNNEGVLSFRFFVFFLIFISDIWLCLVVIVVASTL